MRKFAYNSLLFIIIFFGLNFFFGYLLSLPKKDLVRQGLFHPAIRWEEFYAQPRNSLDLIFLGSSHCYCSFDPEIFDRSLKIKSFNMGSSVQTTTTGYYVLKQILEYQKPKVVVLEVFWRLLDLEEQFINASYNLEFIRDRNIRYEFLMRGHTFEERIQYLFPSYVYRNNFTDLIQLARGKKIDGGTDGAYKSKGFVEMKKKTDRRIKKADYNKADFLKEKRRNIEFLHKIIELCQKQNIKLVLVTAPLSPDMMATIKMYDEIHSYIADLAAKNNIPYIDYNLINQDRQLFKDEDFFDPEHVNKDGVKKVSEHLGQELHRHFQ